MWKSVLQAIKCYLYEESLLPKKLTTRLEVTVINNNRNFREIKIWLTSLISWFRFGCVRAKLFQLCLTPCDPMDCSPPDSSVHGDSPGKNTWVGCHALLQGIFPTQGFNPHLLCLLHWQASSLSLVPPGKLTIYICVCVYIYMMFHNIYIIYNLCLYWCIYIVYIYLISYNIKNIQ